MKNMHTMMETFTNNEVTRSKFCSVRNDIYKSTMTQTQYDAWKKGGLIQNVCPNMSRDDAEFWISGTTPDEWNEMFPPGQEEE